jgi:thiamine-phosphate pyrophosphorylase
MAPLHPRLIAITDTQRAPFEIWLERLESLAAGASPGSVQVLLRDRQLAIRDRRQFGASLRALTARYGQTFSVNDRLDLAVLLDADAIHLSESSVTVEQARQFGRRYGRAWGISRACHDSEEISRSSADALLLSPVLAARKGRAALGAAGLAAALRARDERGAELGPCLLYALGGVTRHNASELLSAGADGVALIGELLERDALGALIEALGITR